MVTSGVNYDLVVAAAEAVLKTGKNPTIERVRRQLGDTGSNTTINKYLSEWKTKKLLATSQSTDPQGAAGLSNNPEVVNDAVSKIWKSLQLEAENRVQEIETNCNEKVEKLLQIKDGLADELKALKDKYFQLQKDYNNIVDKKIALKKELEDEKLKSQENKFEANKFESLFLTLKEEKKQQITDATLDKDHKIKTLQAELKELYQTYNSAIDKLRADMEAKRHKHIAELENTKVQKNKFEQKLNVLEAKHQGIIGEKENLQKVNNNFLKILDEIKIQNQENKKLYEAKIKDLTNNNLNLEKLASKFEQENVSLQEKNTKFIKEMSENSKIKNDLKSANKIFNSSNVSLQEEIKVLKSENEELKNEKEVLFE